MSEYRLAVVKTEGGILRTQDGLACSIEGEPLSIEAVARHWAKARQAAVEVFASVSADSVARTAAWARLSEAERALLDAVKACPRETSGG